MSGQATTAVAPLPRVLVLMATRNGEPWIDEQLESVFAQSGVEVAVRVSDDCSTDATPAMLGRWARSRPALAFEQRPSPSGSAGANFRSLLAAADLAGFDYVALADQDDVWQPDHLRRGCAALAADPCAGGYSCAVRTFGAGKPAVLAQQARPRRLDYLFEGAGQGCTFVFTPAIAARVQRLCQEKSALAGALHYHDWLIYLVARRAGWRWIFDDVPGLSYRQHANNEIGARSGGGAVARRVKLIREGWYRKQIAAALALACELEPGAGDLARFRDVFCAADSLARRVRLARMAGMQGRRRPADRLVLCCSALAGWF